MSFIAEIPDVHPDARSKLVINARSQREASYLLIPYIHRIIQGVFTLDTPEAQQELVSFLGYAPSTYKSALMQLYTKDRDQKAAWIFSLIENFSDLINFSSAENTKRKQPQDWDSF